MKISIAMATYNGAKYLQEQLDSFTNQTRLPDELVICDDVSSDETIEILTQFSETAPFKVVIVRNEKNLGYGKNFEKVILLCSGDYIFLSDQDDIWFANKLEAVISHFEESGAQVVINDIGVTYSKNDKPVSYLNKLKIKKISEDSYCTGCATAITKEFKDIIFPFPASIDVHDTWINRIGLYINVRSLLPVTLQIYRRHDANVSMFQIGHHSFFQNLKKLIASDKNKTIRQWQVTIDQNNEYLIVMKNFGILENDQKYSYLSEQSKFYKRRILCLNKSRFQRIRDIIGMIFNGQYKYTNGWRSAAFDLLV